MSLGGSGYSQTLKDAVDLANTDNVVVIAAAGNDGKATVLFPAGFPGVMAVGATDPTNARATFSSYGPQLSVVAPGVDIYSTLPTSGPISSPTGFGFESGTSMAAPHVAGVAALVRAANPGFSVFQVRSKIEQTATNLPTPGGGFNPQFGWGLVNAGAAIGTTVTNTYGSVQVTVTKASVNTPGVDVVIWVGTAGCSGLSQFVKTTQTTSTGVAVFNQVPVGSYCATASQASTPPAKGATPSPFAVAPGPPATAVTVTIM
jgi:subtilisin family serine protease